MAKFQNKKGLYIFENDREQIDVADLSDADINFLHELADRMIREKHFQDWGLAVIAAFMIYASERYELLAPREQGEHLN